MQCPEGAGLPRCVFLTAEVLEISGIPALLAAMARQLKGVTYLHHVNLLTLARLLQSVVGGAHSPASEIQKENV